MINIPTHLYSTNDKGCFVYKGRINKVGRPAATLFGMPAFRILLWLHKGPPPEPHFHAAHTCHNPLCINPDHGEWQLPDTNNPYPGGNGLSHAGIRIVLGKRASNKGGGRVLTGTFARFRFRGKCYKSGAYYSKDAAIRWAKNKIDRILDTT